MSRRARLAFALATFLVGCSAHWNDPIRQTDGTGWHHCPGTSFGCSEWAICSLYGCRWWGDPNGMSPDGRTIEGESPEPDR